MKKIIILFAIVAMLCQQQAAQAQAAPMLMPVFNAVINRAVASGIVANLARRGITVAANDATLVNTLSFVGKAANDASYVSLAAGTVATVAGAPVWLATAVSLGVIAAAGAIAWGVYKLSQVGDNPAQGLKLAPDSPSTVQDPPPAQAGSWTEFTHPTCNPQVTTTCTNPLPSNYPYWNNGYPNSGTVVGCVSGLDCAQQVADANVAFESQAVKNITVTITQTSPTGSPEPLSYKVLLNWTPLKNNPTQTGTEINVNPSKNANYVKPLKTETGSITTLPLTPAMLAQPLPQSLTASITDALWRSAAARPDYNGYPYSPVNPVTSGDVATATIAPTWSDLVQGYPKPFGAPTVPISSDISTGPVSPPVTNPPTTGNPTSPDLCQANPSASACAPLGSAPPGQPPQPVSKDVSLTPWSVGPSDGVCPAPIVVNAFGQQISFSLEPLCSLVQKLRPLVLSLCALAAAIIFVMGVSS